MYFLLLKCYKISTLYYIVCRHIQYIPRWYTGSVSVTDLFLIGNVLQYVSYTSHVK